MQRILDQLLATRSPLTLEALGLRLGIPPVVAAQQIEQLRRAGCEIEQHPQQGVRLAAAGLECWADYIEPRHANRIGRRLTVYRQTTSTQDVARRLIAANGESHDGHVIAADQQTAGRGRLGRRWLSMPGSALLLTAIVAHGGASLDRLMIGSCCALAEAVEHLTPLPTQIRWPNDLLIDGDKLAGILVEIAGPFALIGIGVNVSGEPRTLPDDIDSPTRRATSLLSHGAAVDRLHLLDVLLDRLDRALHHADDATLTSEWKRRATLLQRRVTVNAAGRRLTGRVVDLDPTAGLMLQTDRGAVVTLPAETTSLIAETTSIE